MGFLPATFEATKQALGQAASASASASAVGLLRPAEEEKMPGMSPAREEEKKSVPKLSRQESDMSSVVSGSGSSSSSGSSSNSSSGPGTCDRSSGTYSRSVSKDFPNMTQSLASQQEEVRMLFNSVDADGDGRICGKELSRFLGNFKLDKGVSEAQIQRLIQAADENGDNVLELEEFFNLFLALQAGAMEEDAEVFEPEEDGVQDDDQTLLDAFSVFDQNKDGFITANELLLVLQSLNMKSTKKLADCSRMIRAVDKDGDDKVNFEEFKHMMANGFQ